MPLSVEDVSTLQDYLQGVMDKANHHALNVNEIALTLVGAIIWRKDEEPIKVLTREGEAKNVLWVKINNNRYAFSYNHDMGEIEMRQGSIQGDVLHSFTNITSLSQIKQIFESL
jgi:hypothetical protein